MPELWLVRHSETEWAVAGRHTGRTDVPLTEHGREQALALGTLLAARSFALVLSSPLGRAADTCRLAGYGAVAQETSDLLEWDYGDYEGLTTAQIRERVPGWTIWSRGVSNGETVDDLARRAQRVVDRAVAAGGDAVLFAHGHVLRVLAAGWLGLSPGAGQLLALDPASVSVLGYERETRVIGSWNHVCDAGPGAG